MKNKLLLSLTALASAFILVCFISPGCGSGPQSLFDASTDQDLVDSSLDQNNFDAPMFNDSPNCTGLECQQVRCDAGGKTTVSGTILDPAGKVPLYNVIVYVPNAPVMPFVDGATCDKCGSTLSGKPLVTTITDTHGRFSLENVPVGIAIPMVIQVGKWRRQITLPSVTACTDTPLSDKNLTRLPRNKGEGDIPKIAMATGGADALECLLRKIGVDDAEFTNSTGTGRINLFQGIGGGTVSAATPSTSVLWNAEPSLQKYDIVLLACEGAPHPETKSASALQALQDYTSVGGRVFASHYHYYWFESGPVPFPTVVNWNHGTWPPDPQTFLIDTSFPKGLALSDWLVNVGGSTIAGQISISQGRNDVDAVNAVTSQRWIYGSYPGVASSVQYLTFNAPVGIDAGNQCGRVVYSDLHVGSGDTTGAVFPAGCTTMDLTPQQKALEFMLFDLSSCVQKDTVPPVPPIK